ncbi:response regulator transcription factor [bacterium]
MKKIRIFIADDNADFRDRVKTLIDEEINISVVGEAPDANHIVKEVVASKADAVLMDVSMPGMNGLDATRMLASTMPKLKIIMVSVYDIEEYKEAALASGAFGYLVKKDVMTNLIPLIREVAGLS